MIYNSGLPVGYNNGYYQQQYFPQYQQPTPTQQIQQIPSSGRIVVRGEEGADKYHVAPNCSVDLWDSDAQVIYIKSADASGMPSTRIVDYTYRDVRQAVPVVEKTEKAYATKEDIDSIRKELGQMKSRLDSFSNKKDNRDNRRENNQ